MDWWICNDPCALFRKENIKFNITDFKKIFDIFKKNDDTVKPGVVKPAGIAQI